MSSPSFGDIVVAFSDFLLCLENADEATFNHTKQFCAAILNAAEYKQKNIIGGIEK